MDRGSIVRQGFNILSISEKCLLSADLKTIYIVFFSSGDPSGEVGLIDGSPGLSMADAEREYLAHLALIDSR